MRNLCSKMKALCALIVMGLGLTVFAATPTITSVTAQQRYPWNGLVDIDVTFSGEQSDVANATCTFAATNSATKTALAIVHVTQVGDDFGSGSIWMRRFLWDTNADVGEVKIDDVELVVAFVSDIGGVQLWEGGPYWAECNVGAAKPEDSGYYFAWGETVGNRNQSIWYLPDNCVTWDKSISELRSLGFIDLAGNLTASHDAATVHLGSPWRMPTVVEFSALIDNCDTKCVTSNGVPGRLVRGKGAYSSRSVFFRYVFTMLMINTTILQSFRSATTGLLLRIREILNSHGSFTIAMLIFAA